MKTNKTKMTKPKMPSITIHLPKDVLAEIVRSANQSGHTTERIAQIILIQGACKEMAARKCEEIFET
jgi:hypothetical protein